MFPLLGPWWRHQMEIFSALLAICAGNSPVTCEFPTQRPVTRSFDVYFDLRPNERLSKQWWGWWFETLSRSLWRHRNAQIYVSAMLYMHQCIMSFGNAHLIKCIQVHVLAYRSCIWLNCFKIYYLIIFILLLGSADVFTSAEWRRLCLSVCFLAIWRTNVWADFHEIFLIGQTWNEEHSRIHQGVLFHTWQDYFTFPKWDAVRVCVLGAHFVAFAIYSLWCFQKLYFYCMRTAKYMP